MTTMIRLFRRPFTTVAWVLVLCIMATLLSMGGEVLYSTYAMEQNLDNQYTTIAVRAGGFTLDEEGNEIFPLAFYEDNLATLQGMSCVELVDLRTLTGAYIPGLTARLGLKDYANLSTGIPYHQNDVDPHNNTTNMSYNEVVMVGTIEQVIFDIIDPQNYADVRCIGLGENFQSTLVIAVMDIEEVLSANPAYRFFADEAYSQYCGKVYLKAYVNADEVTSFFETGKRYIVSGMYDPGCAGKMFTSTIATPNEMFLPWLTLGKRQRSDYLAYEVCSGDQLLMYRKCEAETLPSTMDESGKWINRTVYQRLEDPVCLAQEVKGNLQDFLEQNAHWQQWIQQTQQLQHIFPVLGTECVETMQCFLTNAATVTQGRTFTREEYETGAKVMLLSEELAQTGKIQVGDTIALNQLLADTGEWTNFSLSWSGQPLEKLNEPDVGFQPSVQEMEETESFVVIGLYRLENAWEDTSYSITPNTIFIPQKAQIPGGYGGCDTIEMKETYSETYDENGELVTSGMELRPMPRYRGAYGVFLSAKIKNGEIAAFQKEVTAAGMDGFNFVTMDQGYADAVVAVQEAKGQAWRLFAATGLCWFVLLLLYLLIFQGKQRRNLGIMRSLGTKPRQLRKYLTFSGILPALLGLGLGTALSGIVSGALNDHIREFLFQTDATVSHSGGQAITGEAIDTMMSALTIPVGALLLLVLVQLAVVALLIWLQSVNLSGKSTRRLLGKD